MEKLLYVLSSITKERKCFDEEILKKAKNRFYIPGEFKAALRNLNLESQLFCMPLNISSLSYHHLELYNLLSNFKPKPNITGISKTRLQRRNQPITNISLPNDIYRHIPMESRKRGTLLYIDKNMK